MGFADAIRLERKVEYKLDVDAVVQTELWSSERISNSLITRLDAMELNSWMLIS